MKEAEIFSRYIYLENNPILSHHTTAKTPSCTSVEHKTCFTPVHNHLSLFVKNTLRNGGTVFTTTIYLSNRRINALVISNQLIAA